ncbi:NAD(P)H-binding protein [Actinokineospora bangkokensis]|uniref:NAD-dependent epimerase n=1 Tax=Actinokineospora bangkokensis TaxID=1193682 RepID=A0A1Q9LTK4_9PSEU|nr:NAD(P)H-binding protein [Actinokineospora bangkokensis]OLR95314.1 NAD-dependent epimerase [Actinokineospora bangkokensis]
MVFLVTGASGHVGRHVVAGLARAGVEVRASSRMPDKLVLPEGVRAAHGDLAEPGTLTEALVGVRCLYLFPVPETAAEVVARAGEAGVRRVVVLSSSSVEDPDSHSGEHHRAVERAVRDAVPEWTFVRPDEFATNLVWKWGHSIRTRDLVRAPYAAARKTLLHEADVAAVAVAAMLGDDLVGRAPVLTGPESLDQREQVEALSRALGRPIGFEEITPEAARAEMLAAMPPPVVDMVLGYLAASIDSPPPVLPTVAEITGKPGRTLEEWARDHVADFTA